MTRLLANKWRGQYDRPAAIARIRRTIRGSITAYKCVLIDFESTGITGPQAAEIMAGWDESQVKACGSVHTLPFPLPPDVNIGVIPNDRSNVNERRRRRDWP